MEVVPLTGTVWLGQPLSLELEGRGGLSAPLSVQSQDALTEETDRGKRRTKEEATQESWTAPH